MSRRGKVLRTLFDAQLRMAADQTLQAVTGVAASVLNRIAGFKLL